jgi:hypothetical protein
MTKTPPGFARLRKAANAESIRQSTLADQRKGRAEAAARIKAAAKPPNLSAEAPRAAAAAPLARGPPAPA